MFWNLVKDRLFDWTFFVGIIILLTVAIVIRCGGYGHLMKFKKWPFSYKIGAIFAFIVLFFGS